MRALKLVLITTLLSQTSHAVDLEGEELFSIGNEVPKQAMVQPTPPPAPLAPLPQEVAQQPQTPTTEAPQAVKPKRVARPKQEKPEPVVTGNLPVEFVSRPMIGLSRTAAAVITQNSGIKGKLKGLRTGDIVFGRVLHSIIAFPDESAPVVAELTDGPFKGARLLGTSRLEPQSQRVFIDFNKITAQGETYAFKASGVTEAGQTGFLGEFHSQEASYFTGDFVASFVSAYFNGLVPRNTNACGYVVEDTSASSAVNKGLAAGALSSADRFRDKMKKVKAFSEMKGPIEIGVLITEPGVQQ